MGIDFKVLTVSRSSSDQGRNKGNADSLSRLPLTGAPGAKRLDFVDGLI